MTDTTSIASDTSYNGWTNYETWLCKLWIDNDQGSQEYWAEQAQECVRYCERKEEDMWQAKHDLAGQLKDYFEENTPELQGFYADMINAALRAVNWCEIAQSIIEDAELLDSDD